MKLRRNPWIVTPLWLLAIVSLFEACGSDDGGDSGTSTSVSITAPGIVSPSSGSQVSEAQPTLTVSNATASNGATPTYTFQVASDSGFASIVAQQGGIAQGSGGQTSWQVSQALSGGEHFWRARAEASSTQGAWSSTASFTLTGGLRPNDVVVINDPLTNGSTQAVDVNGGTFTDRGWRVENNSDYLRYEVDSISSGFVQWNNVGLTERGATDDSHMLFVMWDPTSGAFRQNAFRVNLQKLWGPTHNPPWLRFRFISQGREQEATSNYLNWDPGATYTWRVQWGPESGANTAKVYLNGVEMMQLRYNRDYLPNTHWIEFGVQERNEAVIDAVYSNVIIGRMQ